MKKTTKNSNGKEGNMGGKAVLVGVGVAALAAAAAGTYFFYGSKDAAKNRKKVKGWMLQAKGEILEQLESVKDINEELYNRIVQEVTDRYEKLKSIDIQEMLDFKKELKNYWSNIKEDISGSIGEAGNANSTDSKRGTKSTKNQRPRPRKK